MRQLTSIVARNGQGAIGASNRLPWRVRTDLRFFRDSTINQVVVMGRRTHDSLGGCLKDRENVVVTHGFRLSSGGAGCRSAGDIDEALAIADSLVNSRKAAFVIGGATMYEQFATFVDRYLITEVDKLVPDADTFFDESLLGDPDRWTKTLLKEGPANGSDDEVSFKIYELLARDALEISLRRARAIERVKARVAGRFHPTDYLPKSREAAA